VPTIAITGKGGTGKTTFASLLVKHLSTKAPLSWLSMQIRTQTWTRGSECTSSNDWRLTRGSAQRAFPLGRQSELMSIRYVWLSLKETRLTLSLWDDLKTRMLLLYQQRVARCPRQALVNYDYVVIDNEAGMEHLSRRTTRDVDVPVLMSDVTCWA